MSNAEPTLDELIVLLRKALADPGRAPESAKRFQDLVFNRGREIVSPKVDDTLVSLAIDLDYLEPTPEGRSEGGFYGEERLVEVILEGLRELEK